MAKNYNWVAIPTGSLMVHFLTNSEFRELSYPIIQTLDDLLEQKLKEQGITCYYSEDDKCYKARPTELNLTEVTAPLFELKNGEYIKIADQFTSETLHPDTYAELSKTIEQCRKEVVEEQTKIFNELYLANTLDNGLSSCILIGKNYFKEEYIPEEFFKVVEKFHDANTKRVVFMKNQKFKRDEITITVPDKMLEFVRSENIKSIAKKFKLTRVWVNAR